MDIKTRLFRKPFTTALWCVLIILTALLLGVGCSLSFATARLIPLLDASHTTVVRRTDKHTEVTKTENGVMYSVSPKYFYQEDVAFFQGLDSVQDVHFHSLTGAYIPELTSLLGYARDSYNFQNDVWQSANESYHMACVLGTVSRITVEPGSTADLRCLGLGQQEQSYRFTVWLQPEQVVFSHPGMTIPVEELRCSFSVYGQDATQLVQKGGRYLFSGVYGATMHSFSPTGYLVADGAGLISNDIFYSSRNPEGGNVLAS